VLLIADEVITGFGRTGKWFAMEHWGVQADMMIFAKGVTSGYLPLSGVMLTRSVHDVLKSVKGTFMHGFTYSGHPTSCAVGLRNLQIIEDEGLVEQVAKKGAHLQEKLQELRAHEIVGDVRGLGLLGAVELVKDRKTKELFDVSAGAARNVWLAALQEGVIVRPLTGDVVAISPPLGHAGGHDLPLQRLREHQHAEAEVRRPSREVLAPAPRQRRAAPRHRRDRRPPAAEEQRPVQGVPARH